MHLLLELTHLDVDDFSGLVCCTDDGRDGEWIDVASEFDTAAYLRGGRHGLLHRGH